MQCACTSRPLPVVGIAARPRHSLVVAVRATRDDSGKETKDWDADWKRFQRSIPKVEGQTRTRRRPPKPRQAQWNGQQREDIRRIERGVLDGWIGEPFFLWGAVGVVLLFVAMLLVGGAPTDSRCTLPWC